MMTARLRSFVCITGANWLAGRKLTGILEALGHDELGAVLDAGCGESPFRVFFPNAHPYIRLDRVCSPLVDVTASLPRIPLRTASVNVILMTHVLADLPDPREAFVEARRVLMPGGRLLVLETTCYPQHDLPHDYYRIMPAALAHLAEQTGFRITSVEYLGGLFTRFAALNSYLLGRLRQYSLLRPLVAVAVACSNVAFLFADALVPRPELAESYCALITSNEH
jgi:SAM-dependent methyltransferase